MATIFSLDPTPGLPVLLAALVVGGPVAAQGSHADTLRFTPTLSTVVSGSLAEPGEGWVPLSVDDRPRGAVEVSAREDRRCLSVETAGEVVALGRLVPGSEEGEADSTGSMVDGGTEQGGDAPVFITWSWFLDEGVPGSSLDRKEGDDYGARVLVNFRFESDRAGLFERIGRSLAGERYGVEAPGSSLSYVWSVEDAVGSVARNPNTDRVATIVVAGADDRGWGRIGRDLAADYQTVFGESAPPVVSIVLFSDSDDTGKTTRSCFGEVELIR